MISVVVCSINPVLSANLEANIANTIGVPYEMIVVDNRMAPKGIGAVYNQGARRAQFSVLCFVHEDVVFSTTNWGKILLQHFDENPSLGLIGIAGSKYKSCTHSGWYTGIPKLDCANVLHVNREGHQKRILAQPNPGNAYEQVVCIDGVFMSCRQKVWAEVLFNEHLLNGFHVYDIDFSTRVSKLYETIVSFEIDLVHLTEGGSFDNNWIKYTFLWHRQQRHQDWLPQSVFQSNDKRYETHIAKTWLLVLMKSNVSMYYRIQWVLKLHWTYWISLMPNVIGFLCYPFLKPILIRLSNKP